MREEMKQTASVTEWDILKGIGALGLPFVHTVETFQLCGLVGADSAAFCSAITALTVFGPSVFMICMGTKLAGKQDPGRLIRSGRVLFAIGLLLNLLRSILPAIIVVTIVGSTADHLLSFLFLSDIYLFAGLFYILLGMLRKLKLSEARISVLSLIMLGADCLLAGRFRTGSETVNALIGNIVYVDSGSVFPLLAWTVFPVFGMLTGKLLAGRTREETDRICVRALFISAAVFVLTATGLYLNGLDPVLIAVSPLNENRTGLFNVVLVLSLNVMAIVPVRLFACSGRAGKLKQRLNWFSANLMAFYFVHWCVLTVLCYAVAGILQVSGKTAGIALMAGLAVLVDAITACIIKKYGVAVMRRILKAIRARKPARRQ